MCTLPEISNYIGGNLYEIPLNMSKLADSRTRSSSNYSNVVSSTGICATTKEDSCSSSFEKWRQHDAYPRSIKMRCIQHALSKEIIYYSYNCAKDQDGDNCLTSNQIPSV